MAHGALAHLADDLDRAADQLLVLDVLVGLVEHPAPIDTVRAILSEVAPGTGEGLDDWLRGEQCHIVVASAGGACIATVGGQAELN